MSRGGIELGPSLRRRLLGTSHTSEYPAVALGDDPDPVRVILSGSTADRWVDVSESHLFLALNPTAIGLRRSDVEALGEEPGNLALSFGTEPPRVDLPWRGLRVSRSALGYFHLRRAFGCVLGQDSLEVYEVRHAEHELLRRFFRTAHLLKRLRHRSARRDPGNIELPGNRYDQVRLAYAVPRLIRVLSVSAGSRANLFPIDLGGAFGKEHGVIVLRRASRASAQLEEIGRCLESQVLPSMAPERHRLGKNHMRVPRETDELAQEISLKVVESDGERFTAPSGAVRWRTFRLLQDCDLGLHRLYLCRASPELVSEPNAPRLAHLHVFGAQWRDRSGVVTRYADL